MAESTNAAHSTKSKENANKTSIVWKTQCDDALYDITFKWWSYSINKIIFESEFTWPGYVLMSNNISYTNIQTVSRLKGISHGPKVWKQSMVGLSHTQPLTNKLNKLKVHCSKRVWGRLSYNPCNRPLTIC
jgi:hypothetical protein